MLPNPERRHTIQDALILTADYGLTERVNLGIVVPYRRSTASGEVEDEIQGWGDITLSGRFALADPHTATAKVNLFALASAPTGKVDPDLLAENIVLGVGAWSLGAGAEVIRDWDSGGSLYFRALGSRPTGPAEDGIRYGGSLWASTGYGRPFVARGKARWALSGNVSWMEEDTGLPPGVEERGGRLITASGGLGLPLDDGVELSLGLTNLLAADLRGDQLASEWSGFLLVRFTRESP